MRSSGHESFCCRYTWLPKAFAALNENPALFSDEAAAMVRLGLGKNMVRSLRFWVQILGVAEPMGRELSPTTLAQQIFDTATGWDPYLEDIQTLWLLHWNLATHPNPLLAWDLLLFRWPSNDITRTELVGELMARATALNLRASKKTLAQHLDTFIRTYVSIKVKKNEVLEDNLDCPLTELRLVQPSGEKIRVSGSREPVYRFRQEEKPEIGPGLFMHSLHQFWVHHHPKERTLSLQQIASGAGSPGKVFRLPESDIRTRLERVDTDSSGFFTYVESVNLQQVQCSSSEVAPNFLPMTYGENAGS